MAELDKEDADNVIINSKKGYIKLKNEFIRGALMEIANAIADHLSKIINEDTSVKLIFLVGGLVFVFVVFLVSFPVLPRPEYQTAGLVSQGLGSHFVRRRGRLNPREFW